MGDYWSWFLAPFGLAGMIVVGKKKSWGWLLSLLTQALWALYAIQTAQYGFLIGTTSYAAVYGLNYWNWHREKAGLPPLTFRDLWRIATGRKPKETTA